MIDCKQILDFISNMYNNGKTQEEISKKIGISRVYICQLLSKKRPVERISVETLNKIFPNCKLILESSNDKSYGEQKSQNIITGVGAIGNSNQITGTVSHSESTIINSLTDKMPLRRFLT